MPLISLLTFVNLVPHSPADHLRGWACHVALVLQPRGIELLDISSRVNYNVNKQ